jgi:hypothetical protein
MFNAKVDFSYAKFEWEADFSEAIFNAEAVFFDSRFMKGADFNEAVFGAGADFRDIGFSRTLDFGEATFKSYVKFEGHNRNRELTCQSSLDFQHARIEHPELISFHTSTLRPHWFINVDLRRFVFSDVNWDLDVSSFEEETVRLTKSHVSSPHRLVAISFRQLATNAESNNDYSQASEFRYLAMESQRQEMDPIWKEEWYEFAFWRLDWWYWATSGYGERIARAFLMLFGIWVVFTLLYLKVGFTRLEIKSEIKPPNPSVVIANAKESGEEAAPNEASDPDPEQRKPDEIGEPLPFKRALTYSLEVMSLQKPEPRPLTNWAHTLVTLETILGPVQAALLALAIRRKFMR